MDTHCPYCALQCATVLTPGGPHGVDVGPRDFPVNRGGLCRKGWTAPAVLTAPDRLTTPLVREGGRLRPASWEHALSVAAGGIRAAREAGGPDAVAVFGGGGLTNEKAYQLGKFARVALGTSQIDYNGRFCMSSAAAAGLRAFGVDRGLPFPVADLSGAEVVLLAGANPAETMPPLLGHLTGAQLVVLDPRRSATARLALERGGVHLRGTPGSDLAVALGLLHVVFAEGWWDREYAAARTTGLERVRRAAAAWWPERVERVTGVGAAELRRTAALLGRARRDGGGVYVLTGRGVEQHSTGTATVGAFIDLALALGLPGRPGSGYGCLTGQGNGQGGREHGQKSDQLPGYRRLDDPAARAHVASVWGVDPASLPGPGRSATELLDSLGTDGGPRALLVFGSNPVVSAPPAHRVEERLRALDLLVVADVVPSETALLADVVLPVTQWAEEEGTMTNLEGRVLRRRRALPPPGAVRSDLEVLRDLAVRLGQPRERFPADPRAVYDELRAASAGGPADYRGITWERLDAGEALHWPCPGPAHPGTPRLFTDRFAHPDGRARFAAAEYSPAVRTSPAHPLYALIGRVLAQYQSGAQTRRVPELAAAEPEGFVEVHPDTAARAGLADGDRARVVARDGTALATVRVDDTLRPDTVFLPFHFPGEERANLLTEPRLDPVSRMPELKVCAVRLEPLRARGPSGAPESAGAWDFPDARGFPDARELPGAAGRPGAGARDERTGRT
uniref:Assimilatory nitrate reductase catalytic subunit n=1 Tax=Streptomyces sp. UC 11065 TaxID=428401 RepID=A3R4T5_9ACTN|nr:assimilatory nitrate reductase catalytic subunit [Streptomyces sp. UC 11065]